MQIGDEKKQKEFLRKFQSVNRKMEEEQASVLALHFGLPYFDLTNFPVDLNSLALLTSVQAHDSESAVFFKDGADVRVGTANPENPLVQKQMERLQGMKLAPKLYFISRSSFNQLMKLYGKVVTVAEKQPDVVKIELKSSSMYEELLLQLSNETGVMTATQILSILLGAATQAKASDIHVEPEAEFVKVRFRLDGVLSDITHLAKHYQKALVSRIKILSKLKLNVETLPQDGRFSYQLNGADVDVRVSVLPSAYGEGIVMRLLGTAAVNLKLEQLGFSDQAFAIIKNELQKPNGMIVTTGPTGSGKTTTLYAFLNQLNQPGVKIITLEDPVEYKLEGINQTPIDTSKGLTFAAGLRAILRQDPDVIMVGEIRDRETAETALQAALTGHVVFSTLHTNDAAGAIPRLVNMGVKPFVIAPAINAIIAQRLVRMLCSDCKSEAQLRPELLEKVKRILDEIPKSAGIEVPKQPVFYHSTGCEKCNHLGYRGRTGIYEVIAKSDELDKLIMSGATTSEIKQYAVKDGMITMIQDGLLKALKGITDVEEVFRVSME